MSNDTKQKAIEFIKLHQKEIIDQFANPSNYPPGTHPFTLFMAGSPGAGKTEFSKVLINTRYLENPNEKIVRIDADEIRSQIPFYKGGNAHEIQAAAAIGVEKLFDFVQTHKQNVLIDGTFANYDIAKRNVERALKRGRIVAIYYVYQDPIIAWDFTKKREKLEGRRVTKETFINSFFKSRENVDKLKQEFKDTIELNLVIKDYNNNLKESFLDIDKVDAYIQNTYNENELEKNLL